MSQFAIHHSVCLLVCLCEIYQFNLYHYFFASFSWNKKKRSDNQSITSLIQSISFQLVRHQSTSIKILLITQFDALSLTIFIFKFWCPCWFTSNNKLLNLVATDVDCFIGPSMSSFNQSPCQYIRYAAHHVKISHIVVLHMTVNQLVKKSSCKWIHSNPIGEPSYTVYHIDNNLIFFRGKKFKPN